MRAGDGHTGWSELSIEMFAQVGGIENITELYDRKYAAIGTIAARLASIFRVRDAPA